MLLLQQLLLLALLPIYLLSIPPNTTAAATLVARSLETPVFPGNITDSGSTAVSTLSRHTPSIASTKSRFAREDIV